MTDRPPDTDRRFHGRRRGRRLRPGLERLLETALPGVSVDLPDGGAPVDPRTFFDREVRDVWLEIGFGAGEHLAWQAERHPDVGMIGAEPYLNGVARLLAAIERQGLGNIRILADDVRPLLDRLPDASLGRGFILFPDPWPKTRHHARRIVNPGVLDTLARTLGEGAELRLATDDQDYLVWMLRHMEAHPAFDWLAERADDWRVRPDDWPDTRYESKNRSGGPGPTFLRYVRVPR
ncbi:MAG: tRNA (guanosine(46)-N7)-methyltransferase TrmB [Alphaproteobacteria bacterium]|nr:tRNA (guanosine(46)-N7)-methyltransferase TrmB [Alphaproteobacteria bacterium]